jgi:hypothetical protein
MKKSLVPFCLTLIIFIGSAGVSGSAKSYKDYCLYPPKHSHWPIAGKCSSAYRNGYYETALREWKPLAKQGNADAQFNLGHVYRRGHGVPKDYKTAVKWYRLAAEQGHAPAQTSLGVRYKKGQGVPRNTNTALKWYKLAAKQGYAPAQHNLGNAYVKGRGVEQNYINAYMWYSKAAAQGHKKSKRKQRIVKKYLTPSQLKKAKALARGNNG